MSLATDLGASRGSADPGRKRGTSAWLMTLAEEELQ
jgi:hypothetical protein